MSEYLPHTSEHGTTPDGLLIVKYEGWRARRVLIHKSAPPASLPTPQDWERWSKYIIPGQIVPDSTNMMWWLGICPLHHEEGQGESATAMYSFRKKRWKCLRGKEFGCMGRGVAQYSLMQLELWMEERAHRDNEQARLVDEAAWRLQVALDREQQERERQG
jgi:hypothetical protein